MQHKDPPEVEPELPDNQLGLEEPPEVEEEEEAANDPDVEEKVDEPKKRLRKLSTLEAEAESGSETKTEKRSKRKNTEEAMEEELEEPKMGGKKKKAEDAVEEEPRKGAKKKKAEETVEEEPEEPKKRGKKKKGEESVEDEPERVKKQKSKETVEEEPKVKGGNLKTEEKGGKQKRPRKPEPSSESGSEDSEEEDEEEKEKPRRLVETTFFQLPGVKWTKRVHDCMKNKKLRKSKKTNGGNQNLFLARSFRSSLCIPRRRSDTSATCEIAAWPSLCP